MYVRITVYVPIELYQKLVEKAKAEGKTISALVREVLERGL